MGYEKKSEELQEIINQLEEGKNFEESIKLFEKGVALSAECVKLLYEGKGKLTELKKTLEGLEEISLEFDE